MTTTVQSVERAAALLRMLAVEAEPVPLTQLATALGVAKATAHALLRTLQEAGFVDQDPDTGRYLIGPDLLHLGSTSMDPNELRSASFNWVDTLAARTGESARIALWHEGQVLLAHSVLRPVSAGWATCRTPAGSALPVHASAVGKVLLAFDPGAARSIVGRELESHTFRTITDRQALQRELADVRDQGWASTVEEELPGVAGIAAPVRDRGGYVVAAVGICGAVEHVCDDRLGPRPGLAQDVVAVARAISRALGHGVQP